MGNVTVVNATIVIEDWVACSEILNTMDEDIHYPWVRREMFNLGSITAPYFYQNPVVSFAASYKNFEGSDISDLILKFEYLLDKIDFDYTRLRFETTWYGEYECYWKKKKGHNDTYISKFKLIEREKWFFGFGFRTRYGELIVEQEPRIPPDFEYPIAFDPKIIEAFNEIIPELNAIPINTRKYYKEMVNPKVFGHSDSYLILTYLDLNKVIKYGHDSAGHRFIERLKEIKVVSSPYEKYF